MNHSCIWEFHFGEHLVSSPLRFGKLSSQWHFKILVWGRGSWSSAVGVPIPYLQWKVQYCYGVSRDFLTVIRHLV